MRSPGVWLTACSCALVLGACGGERADVLPSEYASPAAEQAERIGRLLEARRQCAASSAAVRLQARTIDAINGGRIPPALQEEVLGRVNLLVALIPCSAMDRRRLPRRDPATEARKLAAWIGRNS